MSNYREINPEAPQDEYTSENQPLFRLAFLDQDLIQGSVVLDFALEVTKGAAQLDGSEDIFYDPIGLHAIFNDITTSTQNQGVVESLQHYPRLVKQQLLATKNREELGTTTDTAVEGIIAASRQAPSILAGRAVGDGKMRFCVKPKCCINKTSSHISYQKTGDIMLSARLCPVREFLFGGDVDATVQYKITDLKLRYQVQPHDKALDKEKLLFEIITMRRDIIESNQQNVETVVPILTNGVGCSCIKVGDETSYAANYNACQWPPGIPPPSYAGTAAKYGFERIQYLVNSQGTALQSYPLESSSEILLNGMRVYQRGLGPNCIFQMGVDLDDGYIFGVPFGQFLDFTRQKFSMDLKSQINNLDKYAVYMFFGGILEL